MRAPVSPSRLSFASEKMRCTVVIRNLLQRTQTFLQGHDNQVLGFEENSFVPGVATSLSVLQQFTESVLARTLLANWHLLAAVCWPYAGRMLAGTGAHMVSRVGFSKR